jgi:hypothetical protein
VDLGDSVGLGLGEVPVVLGLGVASAGKVFCKLGVLVRLGEPLIPLGLGGSDACEEVFRAPGLGGWGVFHRVIQLDIMRGPT